MSLAPSFFAGYAAALDGDVLLFQFPTDHSNRFAESKNPQSHSNSCGNLQLCNFEIRAGRAGAGNEITHTFENTDRGGRLLINTKNTDALSAIYEFLRFQIKEHKTGDPLEVKEQS